MPSGHQLQRPSSHIQLQQVDKHCKCATCTFSKVSAATPTRPPSASVQGRHDRGLHVEKTDGLHACQDVGLKEWLTCFVVLNNDADKDALNGKPERILGPVEENETQPWSVHYYQVSARLSLGGHIEDLWCILQRQNNFMWGPACNSAPLCRPNQAGRGCAGDPALSLKRPRRRVHIAVGTLNPSQNLGAPVPKLELLTSSAIWRLFWVHV